MSALFCLFLCFRSYSEKLEEYIPTFYKIRYILEELYVAVMWIISRLIIYIDQLNTAHNSLNVLCFSNWDKYANNKSWSHFWIFQWKKNQKDSYNFWHGKMTLKFRIVFNLQFKNNWKAIQLFHEQFQSPLAMLNNQ